MQDRTLMERVFDGILFIFVPLVVHSMALGHWLLDPFGVRRRIVNGLLPELARFPSATSRSIAIYSARIPQFYSAQVSALLFGSIAASVYMIGATYINPRPDGTFAIILEWVFLILASFWLFAWLEVARIRVLLEPTRRALRIRLSRIGLPTCVACGYNLKGNVSGICSECGQHVATVTPN